jgi:hypothetical protein
MTSTSIYPDIKHKPSDDIERKQRNALWAANQLFDTLGLVERHKSHIRRLWKRYENEPEFRARITELGLMSEVKKIMAALE